MTVAKTFGTVPGDTDVLRVHLVNRPELDLDA